MTAMKETLIRHFKEHFGYAPSIVVRAPGRLEILGNHTDYNLGTVLSCAVDRYAYMAMAPVSSRFCRIWDSSFNEERSFDIDDLANHRAKDWANYIKGMIVEFNRRGVDVPAFDAVMWGNVPLSAGMSSSAALEMSTGLALCGISGASFDWLELAKIGQACENSYVGANTGLMDQFSSLRGFADSLVYSDFLELGTRQVRMPSGYSFVVVNSMVKHQLTNEYNERRASCEEAVRALKQHDDSINSLRDVTLPELLKWRDSLTPFSFDCAGHVLGENIRVALGLHALGEGDMPGFGQLMFQSHDSSRNLFKNSSPELDTLVDLARGHRECLGARLSGGGFGGITVHLVRTEEAQAYSEAIAAEYAKATGVTPQAFVCRTADGASLL